MRIFLILGWLGLLAVADNSTNSTSNVTYVDVVKAICGVIPVIQQAINATLALNISLNDTGYGALAAVDFTPSFAALSYALNNSAPYGPIGSYFVLVADDQSANYQDCLVQATLARKSVLNKTQAIPYFINVTAGTITSNDALEDQIYAKATGDAKNLGLNFEKPKQDEILQNEITSLNNTDYSYYLADWQIEACLKPDPFCKFFANLPRALLYYSP